jgi:LCP family protein required for cell wall assembly
LVAFGLCLLVGYYGYQASQLWRAPLGPSLGLPSRTPNAAQSTASIATITPIIETYPFTPGGSGDPQVEAVYTPLPGQELPGQEKRTTPLCNGPINMTLLAIGTDARSGTYTYGLADMMRIVRIDFVTPRVTVLEIPRDLWVEIPGIEPYAGVTHERLNQAYLYGNPGFGYYDGPGEGPGLLARTLELNFGIRPDHYVAVNMRVFVKMVNAVDGIDVTLPHAVDGRAADQASRNDLLFKAGTHHLNGEQALMLGRIRMEGVFARAEQQNYVLCGFRDKLLSPAVVPKIPDLVDAFRDSVQTDLSPEQISQIACLGTYIKNENLVFTSFPEELFTGTRMYDPVFKGRVFIWDVDYDVLKDYVARFNAGTWPSAPLPSISTPAPNSGFVCPRPNTATPTPTP